MTKWHISETMVVRMTGFSSQNLTQLRFVQTIACIRQILACETQMDQLHQHLLTQQFPQAVSQAHQEANTQAILAKLSTWRRAIGRRRCRVQLSPLPDAFKSFYTLLQQWNQLHERHISLLAQGKDTWEAELQTRRQQLWQTVANPRIQEAIFLSSPGMFNALQQHQSDKKVKKRNSSIRKFERRLVAYLQRLCMKNETQSFFGPINYGQLDVNCSQNIQLHQSETALRQRVVFPSFWMAEAISEAMSTEPEFGPYLKPRRGTFCLLEKNQLYFPASGNTLLLSPLAATLFQQADGTQTIAQLTDDFETAPGSVATALEMLSQQGALVTKIIIPNDISDPLAYLQMWLSEIPATVPARSHWSEKLSVMQDTLATFATADLHQRINLLTKLEEQFQVLCDRHTRRGKGKMYADRLLFFEECLGQLEIFTLGHTLAQTIQARLQPILRLWQAYGRFQAQHDRQIAQTIWQAAADQHTNSLPFLAYLQTLSKRSPTTAPDFILNASDSPLNHFLENLKRLIKARSDGHCTRLQSTELPALPLLPDSDACDCCSVDLMIAAPNLEALQAGEYQIILGEGHPQPLPWVFPTAYFLPDDGQSIKADLSAGLLAQPGGPMAAQVAFTRKSKIYPYPLPGAMVELRPRYPDCRAIPIAAVQVRPNEDKQLRLWAEGNWLRLYPPLVRRATGADPLVPFAFTAVQPLPIDMGQHTPRIEIDNIVYQREKWALSTQTLSAWPTSGFDLFLQAWRWKDTHRLPEEVFVRTSHEPKPLYIDFTNYFLVELLAYLSHQSQRLSITEMLPHTQQLWLESESGSHCCELRTLAIAEEVN